MFYSYKQEIASSLNTSSTDLIRIPGPLSKWARSQFSNYHKVCEMQEKQNVSRMENNID